jgi:hypothetical protein
MLLQLAAAFLLCSSTSVARGELEVIGAGLGRTGTLSLHAALEELGYRAYHYVDFSHTKLWYEVTTGEATIDALLQKIVDEEGYTAIMDNPAADIYTDLLKKYPNAKVILSVRDSPQQFAKSWKVLYGTIEITERDFSLTFPSFFQWISPFWYLKRIRCFMGTTHLGLPECHLLKQWSDYPAGWIEEQYERHNRHVMEHVPAEQLLFFNVKAGWEPLCDFLEKPVPDGKPFPHVKVNTSSGLLELKQTLEIVVWSWIPISVFIVVMTSWAFCFRRRHTPEHTKQD